MLNAGLAGTAPTGVERIGAAPATPADGALAPATGPGMRSAVAVLDTGITDRPDLNVVGGYDCSGAGTTQDSDGHGTHVAGDPHHLLNGKYYGDLAWTGGY